MIYSIQALRALAAWIVVAHHYVQIVHGFNNKTIISSFLSNYGSIGVDIFFVISGFVIYLATIDKDVKPWKFALNRAFRIIPLYWVITLVTAIIIVSTDKLIPLTEFNTLFFIKSLFFLPAANPSGIGYFPLVTVGWTLNFEMMFYFIFSLALFFSKKTYLYIVFISVFLLNYFLARNFVFLDFYKSKIIYEFLIGILLAISYKNGFLRSVNPFISVFIFFIGVFLIMSQGHANHAPLKNGFPCALIIAAFIQQENFFKRIPLIKKIGDYSYSTYLIHVIVISVMFYFSNKYNLSNYLLLLSSTVSIFIISIISYRFLEKPINDWAKRKFI